MKLTDELVEKFSTLTRGSASIVNFLCGNDSWVVKTDKGFGVAIRNIKEVSINEKAASVRIWNGIYSIGDETDDLIFLTSTNNLARVEFASICAQFLDYGTDNANRNNIVENPLEWWEKWKHLLGNSISEKLVYDVIGELLVYEMVYKVDQSVIWSADEYGIIDVTSNIGNFEVKSSVNRYANKITISSQYQLSQDNLFLIFCVFEKNGANPQSINNILDRINLSEVDRENIENKLTVFGYEKGSSTRNENYTLIEMKKYKIDERFPRICDESFLDGKFPKGITKIVYDVSLDGLDYELL